MAFERKEYIRLNADAKCRAFVDLKCALDRANAAVILEELVGKGVKEKLLKWLDRYLSDRRVQGSRSDEMKRIWVFLKRE